jgi:nitrogen-specific signal transduction histidine kinase
MIGFSDRDLQQDTSLWVNRIHPRDRRLFSTAWKKLQEGEKMVSCDYRFTPNKGEKVIWLRDTSVSYRKPHGGIEGVASVYTDISDLKLHRQKSQVANVGEIMRALIHEIQNSLQVINTGVDLLRLDPSASMDSHSAISQTTINGIERTNKAIQELREYFFPPKYQFSTENPGIVLDKVVHQMEKELGHQGVQLRMVRHSSLPLLRLDLKQFRSALVRVMEFSRALLPRGGELQIEAGLREISDKRYVELKVTSSSTTSLEVEEKEVFQPFLCVNKYQVGLGIALARQILRSHGGKIFFRKENPKRGFFTILLEAC